MNGISTVASFAAGRCGPTKCRAIAMTVMIATAGKQRHRVMRQLRRNASKTIQDGTIQARAKATGSSRRWIQAKGAAMAARIAPGQKVAKKESR